nr:MAG TPA: Protein of unknown function (DUF1315) [Bacteriophage sp.]
MRRIKGEAFKKLVQSGKWPNLDILSSYFTGYEIDIYMKRRTHID